MRNAGLDETQTGIKIARMVGRSKLYPPSRLWCYSLPSLKTSPSYHPVNWVQGYNLTPPCPHITHNPDREQTHKWQLRCLQNKTCLAFASDVKAKVAQSSPTLWDPMDYTYHGILQARILEWVPFPFSRGSSQPRDRTQVSCIAGRFFTSWTTKEAQEYWSG